MSDTADEIATQPSLWPRAAALAAESDGLLPPPGASVAVLGCGTSHFVSQAYAESRRGLGVGFTEAPVPSEVTSPGPYDAIVAISRSGMTTEVLRALQGFTPGTPTIAITTDADVPLGRAADETIVLDFANERSVVQTRFATCALVLLRAHLGFDPDPAVRDGESAIDLALPIDPTLFGRFVFLGRGWTIALASEAALKVREAAGAWSESYPAFEYRHGPMSVPGPHTLVWALDMLDPGLHAAIARTGAMVRAAELDPLAELVLVQRTAVALAEGKGLDPDRPAHLSRSVILT